MACVGKEIQSKVPLARNILATHQKPPRWIPSQLLITAFFRLSGSGRGVKLRESDSAKAKCEQEFATDA
jgi:hypothetical protein